MTQLKFQFFGSLLVGLISAGGVVSGLGAEEERRAFERSIDKAVRKAQAELEQTTELWVDRSQWENAWNSVTAHYSIRYTGSRRDGARYEELLEGNFAYFREFLGVEPVLQNPLNVFVFPDINAYNQYSQNANAGAYSSIYGGYFNAGDGNAFPVVTYAFSYQRTVNRWLVHGAMHQYLAFTFPAEYPNLGGRQLDWVANGLAAYFEIFQDWDGIRYHFQEMLRSGTYLPLRTLLATRTANFSERHFTELGMFFYYMIHIREDTGTRRDENGVISAAPFRDYLLKLIRNADCSDDPVHRLMGRRLLSEEFDVLEEAFRGHQY